MTTVTSYTKAKIDDLLANVGFDSLEYNAGNSGAAITLNYTNGQYQKVTLNNAAPVLTLAVPPSGVRQMILRVIQDGTGGRVPSWVNVRWSNGVVPILSSAANSEDAITLLWSPGEASWRGFYSGGNFS